MTCNFWKNNPSHNNITKQCHFPCFYSQAFANENGFAEDLKHWDIPFWSQKHKEHLFRLRNKFLDDFPLISWCTVITQYSYDNYCFSSTFFSFREEELRPYFPLERYVVDVVVVTVFLIMYSTVCCLKTQALL